MCGGGGGGGGGGGVLYFTDMKVFGSFSFWRANTHVLHASGDVNAQAFVWTFLCSIYKFPFIQSFIHTPYGKSISQPPTGPDSHFPVLFL